MHAGTLRSATAWRVGAPTASRVGAPGEAGWRAPALRGCSRSLGGALPADNTREPTTRVLKIRGPANLAGAWSAQPVPASRRPPRAAHRPAAARAPRTVRRRGAPAATARPRQQPLGRARTRAAGHEEAFQRTTPAVAGRATAITARSDEGQDLVTTGAPLRGRPPISSQRGVCAKIYS